MPNRLAGSNSPYLLQHQHNPVDWYPWGPEALARAAAEDKPIFLSIGYAACHWCHVMAHESFEDKTTAAYMNAHFVNVKVDREERPDIDGIYMNAVVAMTGSGGWPLSVFLSPDGVPFLGGTYFPPIARHNLPSFMDALQHVYKLWTEEREKVLQNGQLLRQHLQPAPAPAAGELKPELTSQAVMALAQAYDWRHGGWGQAPKFPQPMTIDFLLARASQGDKLALDMARHALHSMALGGMYDVVGGGFARYSVDNYWRVPHFEKMLYDNALLARAYLHGYLLTRDESLRQVCERTLDFVARELRDERGGFYSSLDADSEGEEGKFYVWSLDEIESVLTEKEIRDLVVAAYGISAQGNFEGKNVLQRVKSDDELAAQFGIDAAAVRSRLDAVHDALLAARGRRVRPGTDDKVLTAWNGLMLAAYAEAARYLGRADYLEIARANAAFLLDELHDGERLLRSWRDGGAARAAQAAHNAYLEDYAALALGLLALYQSDPDLRWYAAAEKLAAEFTQHYADPAGGFFDTRDDHETLITRPKDQQDNATPSGGAMAALALLQLHAYTGNGEWHDAAAGMLGGMQAAMARYPTAFAMWLQAAGWLLAPGREIAIVGADAQALLDVLWGAWRPFDVAAISPLPPAAGAPPLLAERPLKGGAPTAYVCRHFACKLPVNTAEDFARQLDD